MAIRTWILTFLSVVLALFIAAVIVFYNYQPSRYDQFSVPSPIPKSPFDPVSTFNPSFETPFGNFPFPSTHPDCKPGGRSYPCPAPEDEGKINASNTPEAQALAEQYGWKHVHVKALAHTALYDEGFIRAIHPEFRGEVGCIIFVHAGDNEGYMFVENKNLDIVYKEPIRDFVEKTSNVDVALMSKFYLSLH